MIPHDQYERDQMGTRLMRAQIYTQIDPTDPIVQEICTHAGEVPTNFDHALDTVVTHATVDTDFILRHMDYQRAEPMFQIDEGVHPLAPTPRFHILDPRRCTDIQGGQASKNILSIHIDETSRREAVRKQILHVHPRTRDQHVWVPQRVKVWFTNIAGETEVKLHVPPEMRMGTVASHAVQYLHDSRHQKLGPHMSAAEGPLIKTPRQRGSQTDARRRT